MSAHLFSFYVPALADGDTVVAIDGDEHRHLALVLRMSAGERVRVTNGLGLQVLADIETVGKASTRARVCAVEERDSPRRRLALALGVLQRGHFEAAVAQCVEVGVTEVFPILAERCHARSWSAATRRRSERVAIAAMKQSGRSWLPPLRDAVTVAEIAPVLSGFGRAVLADVDGGPLLAASGDAIGIVGPEAGFTEAERSALRAAGAVPAALSSHRLRAETAAVVLAAALGREIDTA